MNKKSTVLSRREMFQSLALMPAAGAGLLSSASRLNAAAPVKIERVEAIKVVVPMRPGVVLSENYPNFDVRLRDFDKHPKFILKIYAGDGLLGLGETAREVPEAGVNANIAYLSGKTLGDIK